METTEQREIRSQAWLEELDTKHKRLGGKPIKRFLGFVASAIDRPEEPETRVFVDRNTGEVRGL